MPGGSWAFFASNSTISSARPSSVVEKVILLRRLQTGGLGPYGKMVCHVRLARLLDHDFALGTRRKLRCLLFDLLGPSRQTILKRKLLFETTT